MTAATIQTQSTGYKLGWWILFALSVLSLLSMIVLSFVAPVGVDSYVAWATFSLYSVFVLLIPYRRNEKWAWYLTWVLIIPPLVLSVNDRFAAPYFISAAGLYAFGQLLTGRAFFSRA